MVQDKSPRAGLPDSYPPDSYPDEEVVNRVRGGEVALFEVLMRRHNRRVYRTARAILQNDADAEDVMQEAYVSAYAHLGDFEGRARFSTWLLRIVVNEALARRRRTLRLVPLPGREAGADDREAQSMTSQTRGPEETASDRELGLLLEQSVDALPEGFRTVFVLRAVEQLSVAETAEVLGVPEETVKTRHHRARGLLQDALLNRVGTALPSLFDFHLSRCDHVVAHVLARIREVAKS
jgi:RNA polymerase sigma-70 factor (ECF subfamily)